MKISERSNKVRILTLVLLVLVILFPSRSYSICNCDSTETFEMQLARSEVVILGTCVDFKHNPIKGDMNILMEVDSSWKRRTESYTTVHTAPGECGAKPEVGKRYIIFATKGHQEIKTSICEPNQLYVDGGSLVLKRLGPGHGPGRPEEARKLGFWMILAGIGGLLFLTFVVLRKTMFKAKTGN